MSQSAASSTVQQRNRWLRLLRWPLIVLCFAILAWMVVKAGPMQLWHTLCQMPVTIALCVAVWGAGYLLNAAAFREVLSGVALDADKAGTRPGLLRFASVLRLTVSGYAINYITPFGLLGGEPYRVLILKRDYGAERATQSVVLYSMMHIASHFCFWLLSVFVVLTSSRLRSSDGATYSIPLALGCLAVVLVSLLMLFWRAYRHGITFRFMRRWVDWSLLNPELLPPGRFWRALLLELLSRLVNVIEYWLIMQSLGYTTFGYSEALLVVAFSSLLANILFFSPLQMGTREGGILLALQFLLPGELLPVALTLSFATRIREFVWIAIGLAFMQRK